jgi:dipeptidyl aminopeptidase/acylaminoacyl peptidase
MKRFLVSAIVIGLIGAAAWTAVQRSRMKHPYSGLEITIPGTDGEGILLHDGWRITPAGRQLASGDMILSAQVSPDGKTLAFTNTGYTRHQLHFVDLASEKEIATFPLERAWSGLAWSPNGNRLLVSGGAGNPVADLLHFSALG